MTFWSKICILLGMPLLVSLLLACSTQPIGPTNDMSTESIEPEYVIIELFSPDGYPITNSVQMIIIGPNKYYASLLGETGTVMATTISWEEFSQIPDGTPVYYGLAAEVASGYFGVLKKADVVDGVIRLEEQVEDN